MKLYIAEKREVAAAISDALGGSLQDGLFVLPDGDKVTWLSGHLLRLVDPEECDERYKKWQLDDMPLDWPIRTVPLDNHADRLTKIIGWIRAADELVNAGDPDPEGQRLVDEVIEYANVQKPVWRVLINDNNAPAIKKAVAAMADNTAYAGLSQSALARAVGDQRYGYNLTRTYTLLARQKGYAGVLSVGRVQTPILGLIVRRDRQIESHQAAHYFVVRAAINLPENTVSARASMQVETRYQVADGDPVDEKGRLNDQAFAENIASAVNGQRAQVVNIDTKREEVAPPLPYNLLALQAEAAAKFNLTPKEVLEITQALRDKHRAITYNRSDCRYLNDERHEDAPTLLSALEQRFATAAHADATLRSKAFNSQKVTAHHAIIPTENVPATDALDVREEQVYNLIAEQYIAQFYSPRVLEKSKALFEVAGYIFVATSTTEISPGWRTVIGDSIDAQDNKDGDQENSDSATPLAELVKDDSGNISDAAALAKQTKPPKRYTMSTLLKDLASVAKYVSDPRIKALLLDKDADKADEKGGIGTPATRDSHIDTLFTRNYVAKQGKDIISTDLGRQLIDALPDFATTPDMTALWHEKQKKIEAGELTMQALLSEVEQSVTDEISRVKRDGLDIKVDLPPCPNCADGHLRQRTSESGKFWGCTNYPDCKATFPDKRGKPDLDAKKKTTVSSEHLCPQCGKGLIRRPSAKDKKKFWWSCSGFPDCKYTTFDNNGKPKL
jgi:DNA topoisomerase type IA central domain protein